MTHRLNIDFMASTQYIVLLNPCPSLSDCFNLFLFECHRQCTFPANQDYFVTIHLHCGNNSIPRNGRDSQSVVDFCSGDASQLH